MRVLHSVSRRLNWPTATTEKVNSLEECSFFVVSTHTHIYTRTTRQLRRLQTFLAEIVRMKGNIFIFVNENVSSDVAKLVTSNWIFYNVVAVVEHTRTLTLVRLLAVWVVFLTPNLVHSFFIRARSKSSVKFKLIRQISIQIRVETLG